MSGLLRKILVAAAAFSIAACANAGTVVSTGERYVQVPDFSETYQLGVGDKVRLTVFNEPSLSGEFSVSGEGDLSLPLIASIPAADRTTKAIAEDVASRLADGYLRDPKVSIEVLTYRPFFILGEVATPGQYPFLPGLTALNAVATANGFTPRAARRKIYIRARGQQAETPYELTPTLRVFPGDTLRLGERYF